MYSVVAGSLVTALAVIYGCSRVTKWHKSDVRDTRHMVKPYCPAKCVMQLEKTHGCVPAVASCQVGPSSANHSDFACAFHALAGSVQHSAGYAPHASCGHAYSDQASLFLLQPEDAAKDVNLKPPDFFVATTASPRQSDGPKGPRAPVQQTGTPPIVILSYGSSSTPTGTNFHHGQYALAHPDAVAQATSAAQSEQTSNTVSCRTIRLHGLFGALTSAVPVMHSCNDCCRHAVCGSIYLRRSMQQ